MLTDHSIQVLQHQAMPGTEAVLLDFLVHCISEAGEASSADPAAAFVGFPTFVTLRK